jgi:hypothetical protein
VNQELGLKILADLMGWSHEEASAQYRWLRVMSKLKYDGYQDFAAGRRFIESLIVWLEQFSPDERAAAYDFVRRRLVYLGPGEMQHLVRLTYPDILQRHLIRTVAAERRLHTHEVLVDIGAREALSALRRRTLFIGLSDGARIDAFRRANVGVLSNEQIVAMPQFDDTKWTDLLEDLRKHTGDNEARFKQVILLDDFVGSGNSLLRKDTKSERWKGKLMRFHQNVTSDGVEALAPGWQLLVHHYVAGFEARTAIDNTLALRAADTSSPWFDAVVQTSFTVVLPASLKLHSERDAAFLALIDRYYDPSIETDHTRVGGADVKLGFAGCGLPVVLDHNTPNNSVALLWAESAGASGAPKMRPLFRRRQRHL